MIHPIAPLLHVAARYAVGVWRGQWACEGGPEAGHLCHVSRLVAVTCCSTAYEPVSQLIGTAFKHWGHPKTDEVLLGRYAQPWPRPWLAWEPSKEADVMAELLRDHVNEVGWRHELSRGTVDDLLVLLRPQTMRRTA